MKFRFMAIACALVAALMLSPAESRAALDQWHGHMLFGYGRLFPLPLLPSDGPAGGFSLGAGVEYALSPTWRIGPDLGYHLLGTQSVVRGSLTANLDYSMLEATLGVHWLPQHFGPLRRISLGAGAMSTSAQVSSSSSGLAFEDLQVSGVHPGVSFDLALLPNAKGPVAVGFEAGVRTAFLGSDTWTVGTLRLALMY